MKTEAEVRSVVALIERAVAIAPNDETLAVTVAMYGTLKWVLGVEPEYSHVQANIEAMRDAVARNDAVVAARRN